MRIPCPLCGSRDRREFYYYGLRGLSEAARAIRARIEDLDNHLFLRDNPAGVTRDLWYHETGCGAWMVVTRNTITHEVLGSELVLPRRRGPEMRIAGKGLIDRSKAGDVQV